MQEQKTQGSDNTQPDPIHELWLIYCQLKDAETDPVDRDQLISATRMRLGYALNLLRSYRFEAR